MDMVRQAIRLSSLLESLAPLVLSACSGRLLAPEFRGVDGSINTRPMTHDYATRTVYASYSQPAKRFIDRHGNHRRHHVGRVF